jgi:hypothetical protein
LWRGESVRRPKLEAIPLEMNAYELDARFATTPTKPILVADEVQKWIRKIEEAVVRRRSEFSYQQFDVLRSLRQEVRHNLLAEAAKHNATKLLR